MVDLSIIIINYNTFTLTKNAINSILKYNHSFSYEIWVVDNCSYDNSLYKLKNYFKQEKNVNFIYSSENKGFAAGNNLAIKKSRGKYILLLNSDTIVFKNTLNTCFRYMENNKDIGALGCKVLLENGELDMACKRSFPNPRNSFYRLLHIPTNDHRDNYNLNNLDDNGIYEIDCLTGAFMFIRKEAIQLLDETFFMYGEDIDLCYRIKNEGWKIIYLGEVEIIHYKGSSSKKQKPKLIYEFYRAMYIYYRKHQAQNYSIITNILVYIGITILFLIKLLFNVFKKS